jgi:hypothetical protein
MASDESQHVFISYVREDSPKVDQLCKILDAAQIPYWRDLRSLNPGDWWKTQIREGIRKGSLVFLACFSENSRARTRNNMNEELTLAVEELRKMPPGHTWMIPVRFDEGIVPPWDLGAGRTLDDVNRVDLFGEDYTANIASLVSVIQRTMGHRPTPETIRALVDEAQMSERPELLRKMTKELLLDPLRRIELDDLISQEVRQIVKTLSDDTRFSKSLLTDNEAANVATVVRLANENWEIVRPFCYSLAVAARWGGPDSIGQWASGIKSIVAAASKHQDGISSLTDLRHVAAVAVVSVAVLACSTHSKWDNCRVLLAESRVPEKYRNGETVSILGATSYWVPFDHSKIAANVFSNVQTTDDDAETLIDRYMNRRGGDLYTPMPDWLHSVLKPLLDDHFIDQDEYDSEYVEAEVMLGVMSQDAALIDAAHAGQDPRFVARSNWFGRSTWTSRYARVNPVAQLSAQLQENGELWGPLRGGLFGGSSQRARKAIAAYEEDFKVMSQNRI